MTPKEKAKAKELVDKFKYVEVRGIEIERMSKSLAKQCALISIKEVLDSLDHRFWQNRHITKSYIKVEQEVQKL